MRYLVVFALLVAGCGKFTPSPVVTDDLLIITSGTLGAVGCTTFARQGNPGDVQKGRLVVQQLDAILHSSTPTVSLIGAVCTQAPDKYAALCSILLQRVETSLGINVDAIPKDGVPYQALNAFVSACSAALAEPLRDPILR